MKKSLLAYSSVDGQTMHICQKIKEFSQHSDIDVLPIEKIEDISKYDSVVIGASIRYGNYRKEVFNFINRNIKNLELKNNGFFSVNAVARKPEKNSAKTNPYVSKFLKKTSWTPEKIGVFAGKIDYPSYKFFDKYAIKFIMKITGGPTDTSGTYEFTKWKDVETFTRSLNL
tara:strand:+ start:119 stop:631 length:513 start_codon:yes stop_codon:yes gene_type:complete